MLIGGGGWTPSGRDRTDMTNRLPGYHPAARKALHWLHLHAPTGKDLRIRRIESCVAYMIMAKAFTGLIHSPLQLHDRCSIV